MQCRARSVAALYDIHGNLPALDAVLAEVERQHVDRIVVGGDIVLGPMPRETLARVRALGKRAVVIRGNCDRLVADPRAEPVQRLPATVREVVEWTAAQLSASERELLGALPTTATLPVEGIGDVLFCHATPRSDEELFTVQSPADQVETMLGGVTAPLVVCGHTHMQFDRRVQRTRVVNAGSVGMPYGAPGAYWLGLGPDVRMERTDYDLGQAAAAVRFTRYPQADSFAARHVLSPPTEAEMLMLFSGPR
ncbi:MAG TPA: metallophosphoesterase family protein [Gemmatimonadaceae bacterium]|jgi:putative phosphoesterase